MCKENFWKDSKVTGVITSERIDWMGQERDFFPFQFIHFYISVGGAKCGPKPRVVSPFTLFFIRPIEPSV